MSVEFDPVYVDKTWLDTVVVIGITSFVLCLKNLSAVSTAKMGLVYGMIGMTALILGYWLDDAYTFDHGPWVIGCKLCCRMNMQCNETSCILRLILIFIFL